LIGGRPYTSILTVILLGVACGVLTSRLLSVRQGVRLVRIVGTACASLAPLSLVLVASQIPYTDVMIRDLFAFPSAEPALERPNISTSDSGVRVSFVIVNGSDSPVSYSRLNIRTRNFAEVLYPDPDQPKKCHGSKGDQLYQLSELGARWTTQNGRPVEALTGTVALREIAVEDAAPLSAAAADQFQGAVTGTRFSGECGEHAVDLDVPINVQADPRATTHFILELPQGDVAGAIQFLLSADDAIVSMSGDTGDDIRRCSAQGQVAQC